MPRTDNNLIDLMGTMATFFYFSDISPTFRHFSDFPTFFGPSCHSLVPPLRPPEVLLFEGTYTPPPLRRGPTRSVTRSVTMLRDLHATKSAFPTFSDFFRLLKRSIINEKWTQKWRHLHLRVRVSRFHACQCSQYAWSCQPGPRGARVRYGA